MNASRELAAANGWLVFMLRTTLAFAACWVVCKLLRTSALKFFVWIAFLLASAGYWLWVIRGWAAAFGAISKVPTLSGIPTAAPVNLWPYAHLATLLSPSPAVWGIPSRCVPYLPIALLAAAAAYLAVTGYLLIAALRNHLKLRAVLRFTVGPPDEVVSIFEELRQSLGVSRCRVRILSGIVSPATVGFIRPVILLPDSLETQSLTDLRDVLTHELHHVRRNDFLWDNVASLCQALLFFQPSALGALKQLRLERELACDQAVVAESPDRRSEYAECLVRFARQAMEGDRRAWGIDFAAGSSPLKMRLNQILADNPETSKWKIGLRAASIALSITGMVVLLPWLGVELRLIAAPAAQILQGVAMPATLRAHHRAARTGLRRVPAGKPATESDVETAIAAPPETEQKQDPIFLTARPRHSASLPEEDQTDNSRDQPSSTGASWPSAGPGQPKPPSITSIVVNAAQQMPRIGDHDHDHD